jgi:hypothetical protein
MTRTLLFIGFLFALLWGNPAIGQNPTAVKPSYVFKDGIYQTLESFQRDQPLYSMVNVEFSAVVNEEKKVVQVEWIKLKNGDTLTMDSIWGLCWSGRPFIRIPSDSTRRKLAIFAELKLVGNISLFSYETEVDRWVEIKAYFPQTNIPFRQGKIKNVDTVVREKMLRLETGEIAPLSKENLTQWVKDRPEFPRAIAELTPEKTAEFLPRLIKAYNERNPFYLK